MLYFTQSEINTGRLNIPLRRIPPERWITYDDT